MVKSRNPAVRIFPQELREIVKVTDAVQETKTAGSVVTRLGTTVSRMLVMGTATFINEQVFDANPAKNLTEMIRYKMEILTPLGNYRVECDSKFGPEPSAFMKANKDKCPFHVAVMGKVKVWTPPDSPDKHFVSIKPESMKVVSKEDVEGWLDETANVTLERIEKAKTKWCGSEVLQPIKPDIGDDDKYSEEDKKLIEDELKRRPQEREDIGGY